MRIQGSYGLWSNDAVTSIFVENVPDGNIELSGSFDVDANLVWEYDGEQEAEIIVVYRDGKKIGSASGNTEFLDRFVLGEHTYAVEYWFENGNYTRSNTLTGVMTCQNLIISELKGGDWIDLRLSESSTRTQRFLWNQNNALQHITAAVYPILELSPYETMSGTFDCAFFNADEAKRFERLRGKTLILKNRDGTVLIGGLVQVEKRIGAFFISYSFTVQQIHWEDYVSYDANS